MELFEKFVIMMLANIISGLIIGWPLMVGIGVAHAHNPAIPAIAYWPTVIITFCLAWLTYTEPKA